MNRIKYHLLVILLSICGITSQAYDFEVDGLYYNLISASEKTCELVGCSNVKVNVAIPLKVESRGIQLTVVSMSNDAFKYNKNIESITFESSSPIKLPVSAFYDCIKLSKVILSNTIESIPSCAFSGCPLENFKIPSNVNSIESGALDKALSVEISAATAPLTIKGAFWALKSVVLGRNIQGNCFKGISTLTKVSFSGESTVTELNANMFQNCGITEISFPPSIASIPDYCFYGCPIKSLTIPTTIETIGTNAFTIQDEIIISPAESELTINGCLVDGNRTTSLNTVRLNRNVKGEIAKNCKNLKTINIGENVDYIPENGFSGSCIFELSIPSSVTEVKKYAFKDCSIKWLDCHALRINENAFYGCQNLCGADLSGVESIGSLAFANCTRLSWLNLGNKITQLGKNCLLGCSALSTLGVQTSTPPICEEVLGLSDVWGCTVYIPANSSKSYSSSEGWKDLLFYQESKMPEYVYEAHINIEDKSSTKIISGVLTSTVINEINNNPNIEILDLRNAVIGEDASGAIYYSTGNYNPESTWDQIAVIRNPGKLVQYTTNSYKYSNTTTTTSKDGYITNYITTHFCDDLTHAIRNSGIKTLYLPKNISRLGESIISSYYLKDIYVSQNYPIECHVNAFSSSTYTDVTLHVPVGCVADYKNAPGWNKFSNIVSDIENSDDKLYVVEQPSCEYPKVRVSNTKDISYQWYVVSNGKGESMTFPVRNENISFNNWYYRENALIAMDTDNSNTSVGVITLPHSKGDILSFDYDVNTEKYFDQFIIMVNEEKVSAVSGCQKGTFTYTLPNDTTNVIKVLFAKDNSNSIDDEHVVLTNLKIKTNNLLPIPNEQRDILNRGNCSLDDVVCCVANNKNERVITNYFKVTDNSLLELVVYTKKGRTAFGFSDYPKVIFKGDQLTVSSSNGDVAYTLEEVEKWKFEIEGTTQAAVDDVYATKTTKLQVVNGEIKAQDLLKTDLLRLFSISGAMITSQNPDVNGNASINIEDLPSGIYIVSAGSNSIKIAKK